MKIFVSHVNDHPREHFNNQVDRMTHSVYTTSQHFSSAIRVITQWTQEQSGHGGRDGGYACIQRHGLHSLRPTWIQPPLRSNLPAAEANTESLI